jgi:hypothetical protein
MFVSVVDLLLLIAHLLPMPGVIVVYLGLMTMFLGAVSIIKPLRFLALPSRWQALAVFAAGLVVVIIGGLLPAAESRVASPRTHLDEFMPAWQFNEFHSTRIAAPKEKVYASLKAVTADEILFFRTLIWIRRFGRPGPESILNPPADMPLLEIATRTSFIVLSEEPNREFVVGTLVAAPRGWRPSGKASPEGFKALYASGQAGFAPAALNFRLEDCHQPYDSHGKTGETGGRVEPVASGTGASGAGKASPIELERSDKTECTLLTTETRVYATDPAARRRFARYWRVIYPGSSLIRRMWLRAIRKRAERR